MGIFAKPDLDIEWQEYSNCLGVDPDLFFPERGASTREAKEVCRACVVRLDCLEFALQNGEKFGIWGAVWPFQRPRPWPVRLRIGAKPAARPSPWSHPGYGRPVAPAGTRNGS